LNMNILQKRAFGGLCCLISLSTLVFGQQNAADCGTVDSVLANYIQHYTDPKVLTRTRQASTEKLEYRLALDINFRTYQLYNGDKEQIIRTAHQFVQKASEIFEREINIKLVIANINIWEKPEPYPLIQDLDYYTNVQQYWAANRPDPRDALVSFSSRGGWFYGGFRMCSSNFPGPNNPDLDVDLFCHELGHTLGSPHTHSCVWPGGPIDRCTNVESTNALCQDGYREYVLGSLMSYCRSVLSFHPLCRNLMRDYAEGKVYSNFRLSGMNTTPATPQNLNQLPGHIAANTPTFEWQAPKSADWYRVQIAHDKNFVQVLADTTLRQSLYRSTGLGEGEFYIRVQAGNGMGVSTWTEPIFFTIPPFSGNSSSPLLLTGTLQADQSIIGSFLAYTGVDRYQVEVIWEYATTTSEVFEFGAASHSFQTFKIPNVWYGRYGNYFIRLRVRKNGVWSQPSEKYRLPVPYLNDFADQTPLDKISSEPILATKIQRPGYMEKNDVVEYIEIATSPDFKKIVYRDSSFTSQLNAQPKQRSIFHPVLEENSDYYVRTCIRWQADSYSPWKSTQLRTGFRDQRFQYLGTVHPNLTNVVDGSTLRNLLYVANGTVYIANATQGFYSSTDLRKWESFIPSTTNGKSPQHLNGFGVGRNGEVYMFDSGNVLVQKTETSYTTMYPPTAFFASFWTSQIQVTEQAGVLFSMGSRGVGRYFNNNWEFYDFRIFGSREPRHLAKRSEEEVWVLMEGGGVWAYRSGKWIRQPPLLNPEGSTGMTFDRNSVCYVYGTFGIVRLNPEKEQWETIVSSSGSTFQKVVFDSQNQLWASVYHLTGQGAMATRLLKVKDKVVTEYADGLNFLKESFDIEFFNDQLLIVTKGGELHRFDESQIQRFTSKNSYCVGDKVSVLLATNSTFGAENKINLSLHGEADGRTRSFSIAGLLNNEATLVLPDTLPQQRYRLSTQTTSPAIQTGLSDAFMVYAMPLAKITFKEKNQFSKVLSADEGPNHTYQWYLDGTPIAGATENAYVPERSGQFSVTVANEGGCTTASLPIQVDLNLPSEITLLQNAPNPIGSATEIAFYLPRPQQISLSYYTVFGQKIGQLSEGFFPAGWHVVNFEGASLAPGVYIYRLDAENFSKSLKMKK
jgi:hypothetical protein